MTLKDVMDPITWFEYTSNRMEKELSMDEEDPKSKESDYKKMLDPIQYFECMSERKKLK